MLSIQLFFRGGEGEAGDWQLEAKVPQLSSITYPQAGWKWFQGKFSFSCIAYIEVKLEKNKTEWEITNNLKKSKFFVRGKRGPGRGVKRDLNQLHLDNKCLKSRFIFTV